MTEWWTYRLSDFLMFSARTYRRLFELYNLEVWPLQLVGVACGGLLLAAALRRRPALAAAGLGVLAAAWLWVAWAFHLQRYATINTAGPWFGLAFGIEAVVLAVLACAGFRWRASSAGDLRRAIGVALLVAGWLAWPLAGPLLGRPWTQAEVFGIAPDPTALATLGLLLLVQAGDARPSARLVRLAWPAPVAWCLVSGATLWTMDAPEAPLLPVLALVAVSGSRQGRVAGRPSADRIDAHRAVD